MAQAYVDTGNQLGNREQLADYITRVDPEETVTMSMMGTKYVDGNKWEWMTEALAARNKDNKTIEGASVSYAASNFTPRVRMFNYTQIPRRPFSVSFSQDAAAKAGLGAGGDTEYNHQKFLKTIELRGDINAMICSANTKVQPAPESNVEGVMDGIQTLVAAANGSVVEDAGNSFLSQDIFNRLAQRAWRASGKANETVIVNGYNKRVISGWSQPNQRTIDANGKKIVYAVDTYVSDFGTKYIHAERDMTDAVVLMLTIEYCSVVWFRPLFHERTGPTGGKKEGYVESELTIEHKNPKASGKIINTRVEA